MERKAYLKLRQKFYKLAGEVGTLAETNANPLLTAAYKRVSNALDAIEVMGEELGYIDVETGNVIDKRFKTEPVQRIGGYEVDDVFTPFEQDYSKDKV